MKFMRCLPILFITLAFYPGPAAAQSIEAQIEESNRYMQEWVAAISDFVKDVRFDEGDVKNFISYWGELNALGEEEAGTEDEEELVDFEKILSWPSYRSWAKSKDLDPDTWMKKWMRITAMVMSVQVGESMAQGAEQMKTQLAELDQQRAELGEEAYQQMKQTIEASMASMSNANKTFQKLPRPSAEEKALIDKYLPQITELE